MWGITLQNRGRGSTGGHQKYKAGIFILKLTLRGSDCVREAFEEVLDLGEAGGVDFEDLEELPVVKEYRDKGKTSLNRHRTDIGQPQAAAGSSAPPPTPAGGSAPPGGSAGGSAPQQPGVVLVEMCSSDDDEAPPAPAPAGGSPPAASGAAAAADASGPAATSAAAASGPAAAAGPAATSAAAASGIAARLCRLCYHVRHAEDDDVDVEDGWRPCPAVGWRLCPAADG